MENKNKAINNIYNMCFALRLFPPLNFFTPFFFNPLHAAHTASMGISSYIFLRTLLKWVKLVTLSYLFSSDNMKPHAK